MAELTVLQELTQLHLSRPGVDATPDAVRAWQERRLAVLRHMAREGSALAARAVDATTARLGVAA